MGVWSVEGGVQQGPGVPSWVFPDTASRLLSGCTLATVFPVLPNPGLLCLPQLPRNEVLLGPPCVCPSGFHKRWDP